VLAQAVLLLENPVLLALAVVETAHDMVALAVRVHAGPARRVAEALGLRLLARHGGRMADEVASLADILPETLRCADGAAPHPAELAALVALTHAAVAVEGIAAGDIRRGLFALRFFEAAERVHALHAPADSHDDARTAARHRVLLRINP
jgi:hypothetical protein